MHFVYFFFRPFRGETRVCGEKKTAVFFFSPGYSTHNNAFIQCHQLLSKQRIQRSDVTGVSKVNEHLESQEPIIQVRIISLYSGWFLTRSFWLDFQLKRILFQLMTERNVFFFCFYFVSCFFFVMKYIFWLRGRKKPRSFVGGKIPFMRPRAQTGVFRPRKRRFFGFSLLFLHIYLHFM